MANTLTPLVPFVVSSFQRVLRQTGSVLGVINTDLDAEAVGKDQVIQVPESAAGSTYTVTPGPTAPALVDKTITAPTVTLDQYKGERFHVTAEDFKKMGRRGPDFRVGQIDAAIAALIHEADAYVTALAADSGSYAIGTAGTPPFASTDAVIQDVAYFLDTQLAPADGRSLILEPRGYRNLFNLDDYKHSNLAPAGTDFASGIVRDVNGLMVGWDQSITSQSGVGTTNGAYLTNGAVAVGDTTVTVDTGTGTILAGTAISFAGGRYKYIVASDYAGGAGAITLQSPILEAVADGVAITEEAGVRNLAMHRDAIYMAARPPAEAPGGDLADDVEIIMDPVTGLGMRLASYPGYHARQYEVSILYGATVVRPELLNFILG